MIRFAALTMMTFLTAGPAGASAAPSLQKLAKEAAGRFTGLKPHRSCVVVQGVLGGGKKAIPKDESKAAARAIHEALGGSGKTLRFGDRKTFEIDSRSKSFMVTLLDDAGELSYRSLGEEVGDATFSGAAAEALYAKLTTKEEKSGEISLRKAGNLSCGEGLDIERKKTYSCSLSKVASGCVSP